MANDTKTRVVPDAHRKKVYAQEARRGFEPIRAEPVTDRKRLTWRVVFQRRKRSVPPPPPSSDAFRQGWVERGPPREYAPTPPREEGLVTPAEYSLVGQKEGLAGYNNLRFARTLRVRRPNGMAREEIEQWARWFRNHEEWEHLSPEGRAVLLETDGIALRRGGAGPVAHAHTHHYYTPEQVQRILARDQTPIRHHGGPCGPECARGRATHTHKRGKSHQPRGTRWS